MTLTQIDKIKQYYLSTHTDYQEFWIGAQDLGMHFGYYDDSVISHPQSIEKMNEVLAQFAKISLSDRILDAGCGFGGSAIWLAENVGCRVEGVNIVDQQLYVAQQASAKHSFSDLIHFSQQDYLNTNFPNDSFSVIWALETLVHNNDKHLFFDEAFRLLKKGGRLLLAEFMLADSFSNSIEESKRLQKLEDGWALSGILKLDEHMEFIKNAGFSDIKVCDLTENVRQSVKRLGNLCREVLPHAKNQLATRAWNEIRYENVVASIEIDKMFDRQMFKYVAVLASKV